MLIKAQLLQEYFTSLLWWRWCIIKALIHIKLSIALVQRFNSIWDNMLSLLEKIMGIFVYKLRITQLDGSDKLCLTRKINRTLALKSKHFLSKIRYLSSWFSCQSLFIDWTLLCRVSFFWELTRIKQNFLMRHILEVKWALFADTTMSFTLLWLIAHVHILLFQVI